MKWLLHLLGIGGPATSRSVPGKALNLPDEGRLVAELGLDLRGSAEGVTCAQDAVEVFHAEGLTRVVDWRDSPDMVLQNLAGLFVGDRALPEDQVAKVVKIGEAAEQASYATLCALDEVLKGTGTRLLNLDTSGDGFNILRVPDRLWDKWHDVALSMFESGGEWYTSCAVLQLKAGNDVPANQVLGVAPR